MNKSFRKYLTASETELLLSAEPRRLAELDEDQLSDLLQRLRRASRKYRTLHRRQAAAQVGEDRSRAKASTKNLRTAVKAEAFEEALARTSAALARAARATARELKAERLDLAARTSGRPTPVSASTPRSPAAASAAQGRGPAATSRSTRTTKRKADTQAQGARRQARRDSR
jgi:hypothetical protein